MEVSDEGVALGVSGLFIQAHNGLKHIGNGAWHAY
jgi:hypothetical protein